MQLQDKPEEKEENNQDNLPEIRVDEINDDDLEQHSETSETYTELLANIDNTKNLEVNTEDVDMDEKPSTSGLKNPKNFNPKYYNKNYEQYNKEKTMWDKGIGISTIIQELANNYLNGNVIWSYYARDQLMIYSNSRELRKADMDEVQRWILSLLKPEEASHAL